MESFEKFQFEGNDQWAQHLATVEIPGIPGTEAHTRATRLAKAKWYKRAIDPSFDLDLVRRGTAAPQAQPSAQPSGEQRRAPEPRSSTGGSAPQSASRPSIPASSQHILCFCRSVMLLMCLGAMFPFLSATRRCFGWSLQLAAGIHGYCLYSAHGLPQYQPFPQAITAYVQKVSTNTDFHYMCYALLFMMGR